MPYRHKFVKGFTYAFYNNSEDLEDDSNFNYWSFDIVHADTFIVVYKDVVTLTKDIISGTDYRWFANDFIFPDIANGCYRFIIIDESTGDRVMDVGDEFEVVDSDEGLQYVKFRNAKNILNYNYEGLPSFFNKFHVEWFNRKPLKPTVSEGYPLSDGSTFTVRNTFTKTFEWVTSWFDEDEHDASQSMIIHSDFQIVLDGEFKSIVSPTDSEYLIDWVENYEFIQAAVRLEIKNRSSSNKTL